MQRHPIEHSADKSQSCEQDHAASVQHDARWLPAPHPVEYIAKLDAAIERAPRRSGATATRAVVGAAVIAGAVTIPDLSVDAMDAPYFTVGASESIDPPQQVEVAPSSLRTGVSSAPVYVPASLVSKLDPAPFAFSTQSRIEDVGGPLPLGFVEQGSERFDLAFAGVELPLSSSVDFPSLPGNPAPEQLPVSDAFRLRVVEIPQVTNLRPFEPSRSAPMPERPQSLAELPIPTVELGRAEEAVVAAFAGELDVSGAVRGAIPGAPATPPSLPQPSEAQIAVPVPSSVAQTPPGPRLPVEVVLEEKTQLGARINGVLTGRVDFQQLDGTIAIRLGSVVDMLHDRFDAPELDRIAGAGALDSFVTLATLQSAGIPIDYDPVYDEVKFGIDYDDAPNATKVQVEQIGAPTLGNDRTVIDQIPR
ncbi:MAG: hypothetical protein AAFQ27_14540 [Pseudomonadota bacterium]